MKFFKLFSIFFIAIFAGFLLVGLFLPSELFILRSSLIKQDVEIIFQNVVDLKKRNAWSPVKQIDPDIKIVYPDENMTVGEGAFYKWTGENTINGMLLIKQVVDNFYISEEISFNKNYQGGHVEWKFHKPDTDDKNVRVEWSFKSSYGLNIPMRYISLFFIKPNLIKFFEEGLKSLEKYVVDKDF